MLEVIDLSDSRKWDKLVSSFRNYDIYYLSGYVKAFKIHGDGEPLLFYYEDDDCRGINVVMKRDVSLDPHFTNIISKNELFDFSTPYGYGGWIIEGNATASLFIEYEGWCKEHNIVSEFVRFHPVIKNSSSVSGVYEVVALGETVSVDITDKELIWTNFTTKNRNVIRKALNSGISIGSGMSGKLVDTFIDIYNQTMDKDNADKYYYFSRDFYSSIEKDLKDNAIIFYAELDGKVIAASILLFANGRLNYHLSGSLRDYQRLAPSNLLLWKAAEWGHDLGCKTFHLGGGVGSSEDGLLRFKKAFYRGDLLRYCIGKKVFLPDQYDRLVKLSHNDETSNFFPLYRARD